ncbi:hypothetical protein RJ640_029926 [Escallonia rubra]|uniref:Uncharacterized protein n=1 Tax=Escallonia rubra TaxID=112253 RepID=A0AA88RPD1_9ASTE|nr:hypothetical protein RJ640_029926 [Escallonia rubra]
MDETAAHPCREHYMLALEPRPLLIQEMPLNLLGVVQVEDVEWDCLDGDLAQHLVVSTKIPKGVTFEGIDFNRTSDNDRKESDVLGGDYGESGEW